MQAWIIDTIVRALIELTGAVLLHRPKLAPMRIFEME